LEESEFNVPSEAAEGLAKGQERAAWLEGENDRSCNGALPEGQGFRHRQRRLEEPPGIRIGSLQRQSVMVADVELLRRSLAERLQLLEGQLWRQLERGGCPAGRPEGAPREIKAGAKKERGEIIQDGDRREEEEGNKSTDYPGSVPVAGGSFVDVGAGRGGLLTFSKTASRLAEAEAEAEEALLEEANGGAEAEEEEERLGQGGRPEEQAPEAALSGGPGSSEGNPQSLGLTSDVIEKLNELQLERSINEGDFVEVGRGGGQTQTGETQTGEAAGAGRPAAEGQQMERPNKETSSGGRPGECGPSESEQGEGSPANLSSAREEVVEGVDKRRQTSGGTALTSSGGAPEEAGETVAEEERLSAARLEGAAPPAGHAGPPELREAPSGAPVGALYTSEEWVARQTRSPVTSAGNPSGGTAWAPAPNDAQMDGRRSGRRSNGRAVGRPDTLDAVDAVDAVDALDALESEPEEEKTSVEEDVEVEGREQKQSQRQRQRQRLEAERQQNDKEIAAPPAPNATRAGEEINNISQPLVDTAPVWEPSKWAPVDELELELGASTRSTSGTGSSASSCCSGRPSCASGGPLEAAGASISGGRICELASVASSPGGAAGAPVDEPDGSPGHSSGRPAEGELRGAPGGSRAPGRGINKRRSLPCGGADDTGGRPASARGRPSALQSDLEAAGPEGRQKARSETLALLPKSILKRPGGSGGEFKLGQLDGGAAGGRLDEAGAWAGPSRRRGPNLHDGQQSASDNLDEGQASGQGRAAAAAQEEGRQRSGSLVRFSDVVQSVRLDWAGEQEEQEEQEEEEQEREREEQLS